MRPNNNVRRGTPNCFCGLPASPAYSEEFGLLYECHYLHNNPWKEITEDQAVVSETVNGRASPDSDQSDKTCVASSSMDHSLSSSTRQIDKPVCGYHIHKDAWDSFFDRKYNVNAEHQELAICPFFNFTFCAFFNLRNSYPLSHPSPPNCFCGLPVMMRHEFHGKLMFTCPNYLIDGARPKCTWKLWANEVPFQKTNGCTHPLQKKGITRLLDPSRQIQNCNRSIVKRDTFSNRNSFSRSRFERNNYNNGGRFQRESRSNSDKNSSYKRDSNYHSSERLDRSHRREHDFGSKDHNYQYQQATFNNRNSNVSRRISNGTGWDPGRNRNKGQSWQYTTKGYKHPTRWNSNDSNSSYHGDNLNEQSIESNKQYNINGNNVDKVTVKESLLNSENDKLKRCRDKDLCNNREKNNIISNESEMGNNSYKEYTASNVIKNGVDKYVKNCPEKDIVKDPNLSSESDYSEKRYNEGNGTPPSLSNKTDSSRLSMKIHMKEIPYISTYSEFSQTKPTDFTIITPKYDFDAETSRLLTENQKLLSENRSLISKQENDQVEKNDLLMQVEQLKNRVNYLVSRVGHYRSEYDSEHKFRQSSQKKLIELQAQVADVMKEIDELRSSREKEREEIAMGNMKCKVCFEGHITHALLPCHHFALCSKCSQVITKCVICRKPKENVVRIYLG
ncbi:death-associated inhibitor of apoptosis 1 [Rhizophagus clarus]|nr:death-associated inhibitor of apoptosis 1 [Rhizophagus clarus]